MWICPKCGREFKRQNQGHYCGKVPTSVIEYIQVQDDQAQTHLSELVAVIRDAVPDLNEEIKWSMPSFCIDSDAIQFAACKKHISLYVGAEALRIFQDRLDGFTCKKDALYLSYDNPIPEELIKAMLHWIFGENTKA